MGKETPKKEMDFYDVTRDILGFLLYLEQECRRSGKLGAVAVDHHLKSNRCITFKQTAHFFSKCMGNLE